MPRRDANEQVLLDVDGVFDIETHDWDRFVVGGIRDVHGFRAFWNEEDFAREILKFEGTLWAHNGGKFDVLWLLDWLEKWGVTAKLFCAGQRITALEIPQGQRVDEIRTGKLTIRDSMAIAPVALKDLSDIAGMGKLPTGLACVCRGRDCGGYCRITPWMPGPDRDTLQDYLSRDCEVLWRALWALRDFCEKHGLDLRGTVGASAWASARRLFDLPKAEWVRSEYEYARRAYFGGRTQVFCPKPPEKWGYRYDINSAYPAALCSVSLPYGESQRVVGKVAAKRYRASHAGIYTAVVEVPRMHIPPLPVRVEHAHRIGYPYGKFAGTWTANELEYAESVGVKILRVTEALTWERSAPLLADFMMMGWKLRAEAGKKSGIGKWMKWFLNSLTGKFAQSPEVENVQLHPEDLDDGCPADYPCDGFHSVRRCCIHRCYRTCGTFHQVGDSENLWSKLAYRPSPCGHIQWSAYLTADTRGPQLHAQMVDDGQGGRSMAYCDTDSVITMKRRRKNVGDELGEFQLEGRFLIPASDSLADSGFSAPKTYAYVTEDGQFIAKAKGIPDAARNFHLLRSEKGVKIDRGVWPLKSAMRESGGRFFSKKHMSRRVRSDGVHFGDRICRDGLLTEPQSYVDLMTHGD